MLLKASVAGWKRAYDEKLLKSRETSAEELKQWLLAVLLFISERLCFSPSQMYSSRFVKYIDVPGYH